MKLSPKSPRDEVTRLARRIFLAKQREEEDRTDAPSFLIDEAAALLIKEGLMNPETHYLQGFTPDGNLDIRPLPVEA